MNYWKTIKLIAQLTKRFIKDVISGDRFQFAKKHDKRIDFEYFISLNQKINNSDTLENKLYNFAIANQKINQYIIQSNEIFSFWHIVGNPNFQFKSGRTIKENKITSSIGGGLCQISGLIYYISLKAGLIILERHNHSVDIYRDETRFCPLGTDATLVYGYKDLRILNPYSFPIKFEMTVSNNHIEVKLLSTSKIKEKNLDFKTQKEKENIIVTVMCESKEIISQSNYLQLDEKS